MEESGRNYHEDSQSEKEGEREGGAAGADVEIS